MDSDRDFEFENPPPEIVENTVMVTSIQFNVVTLDLLPNYLLTKQSMGRAKARKKREQTAAMSETVSVNGKLAKNQICEKANNINILLLGCTGVGKSTFINSFANYLSHSVFDTALSEELVILIPTKIRVTDQHGESREIRVGADDQNEHIQTGDAQTQRVKTYVFPIADKNVNIRLIDTPGMGDPRGIEQDDINCENILNYIGNLEQLHAICFLLKPNESRDTVLFKYCICQIFSRLDKSACNNIIFIFTHTRGTDYSPGETIDVLKKNVEEIKSKPPHATIPTDRNIFCFDNEGFRCLVGLKKNVDFDDSLVNRNMESWRKSVEECWKLFHYITGDEHIPPLRPHTVRSTKAVNEARRLINRLAKPLADVGQLIQDNIYVLERHRNTLELDEKSLDEMKIQLYIPVISLDVHPLEHPTTVCTSRECADFVQVGEMTKWHYKQRCHEPCGLGGVVAKEIVGDPQLLRCWAINKLTGDCNVCGCNFKVHMHVYYLTEQKESQEVDPNVQLNITTTTDLVNNKKIVIRTLEQRQYELEQEHQFIIESSAKFAHFLQNNALTPFSDAYKQYIEYLIEREKSLGRNCNTDTLNRHKAGLAKYVQMKNQFDKALQDARRLGHVVVINQQEVRNCFEGLCKMKHHGAKIKELYELQEGQIIKHQAYKEYVHDTPASFQNYLNRKNNNEKNNKENSKPLDQNDCTAQPSRNKQDHERANQLSPDKLKQDGNHASMQTKNLSSERPYPYHNNAFPSHFFPGNPYFPQLYPGNSYFPQFPPNTPYFPQFPPNTPYFPQLPPNTPYFPQLPPNTPFLQLQPGNRYIPQLPQVNSYFPQFTQDHLSFYGLPNFPQAPLNYPHPNVFEDVYNQSRNSTTRQNPFKEYSFNSYQENGSTERLDMYQPRQNGNNAPDPIQNHPDPRDVYSPNFRPGKLDYLQSHPVYSSYPNLSNIGNSIEKQNPYECAFQDNRSSLYNHKENGLPKTIDQPSRNQPKQNGYNAPDPIQDHPDPRELYQNNTFPSNSYPTKPYVPQFQADNPYSPQFNQGISSFYHQLNNGPPGYSSYLNFNEDAYNLRRDFMARQNSCDSLYQDIQSFFNGDQENESTKRSCQPSMMNKLKQEGNNAFEAIQEHSDRRDSYYNNASRNACLGKSYNPQLDPEHFSFKDPQTRPGDSSYPHFNEDDYIKRTSSVKQNPYECSYKDNRTSFNGDKENDSTKMSYQPSMSKLKQEENKAFEAIQEHSDGCDSYYNNASSRNSCLGKSNNPQLDPEHSSFIDPETRLGHSSHPHFNEDDYIRRISSFTGDKGNNSTKRSDQSFMHQFKQNENNASHQIQDRPNPREIYHNNDFPLNPYPGNPHFPPSYPGDSYLPQLPMGDPFFSQTYSRHPSLIPLPSYPQRPPGFWSEPDLTKRNSIVIKHNYNRGSYQDNRKSFNTGQERKQTKRFGSVNGNVSDSSYQSVDEEFDSSLKSFETMKEVGDTQNMNERVRKFFSYFSWLTK